MAAAIPAPPRRSSHRPEKDITLALALAIRDALAATGRVRVAMTREDDRYLVPRRALPDRPPARRRPVHLDPRRRRAAQRRRPRRHRLHPVRSRLGPRRRPCSPSGQNAADRIAGARLSRDPNVNLILIDLAQRESMNVSADFARLLYREAAPVFPFRPDWHRFAAFVVLKAPDIPSILFESGYLTNQTDAAYISSPEGRRADRRGHAPRDRGPFRAAADAGADGLGGHRRSAVGGRTIADSSRGSREP